MKASNPDGLQHHAWATWANHSYQLGIQDVNTPFELYSLLWYFREHVQAVLTGNGNLQIALTQWIKLRNMPYSIENHTIPAYRGH